MRSLLRGLGATVLVAASAGCLPYQNTAMYGNADGVAISYAGDVAETMPIARRHCAQFERQPVLRNTTADTVFYACIRVKAGL